ncbi:LAMI_0C02784g1_1 [Lachancea mirantina]|uniref:LAMI_0C02784g1_1 n=1 Tax=Lachancea mirantina TaxID=1230905 RepID=A0A1G4J1B0_9SACH|nr:LAMI_0C02784g1_1 [Lachancea mirantina]
MSSHPNRLDVKVEQLRALYTQFQTLLDEKVALHLPEEQDAVKREVLVQLQKYLVESFEMVSGSLHVVNGAAGASLRDLIEQSRNQFVEPFDLELNEQVRQKYQEWEDETVKVAQLRCDVPKRVGQGYQESMRDALREADATIDSVSQPVLDASSDIDEEDANTALGGPQDRQALLADYRESLIRIRDAQQLLPASKARLRKIQSLVMYLESETDQSDSI